MAMGRSVVALVAFTAATLTTLAHAPGAAAQGPCIAATAECTEFVDLGSGRSRSMVYRTYALDERNEAITRVLVMVHGAGRDADNYFRSTLAGAFLAGALDNTIVIAPRMASNNGDSCRDELAPNEVSWHCNSWRSGGPALTDSSVTSFDFLDAVLRKVARRDVFPNLRAIVVAGHSAGGQVVNRYEMTNQVHDALGVPVTYIVANPSSYAWPSDERPTPAAWSLEANAPGYIPEVGSNTSAFRSLGDGRGCTVYDQWPYGLENHTGYSADQSDEQIRGQLASRPTTYLLGQLDILPLGGFDSSCAAMAQGPTRQARGQAFAKYVNEELGGDHAVVIVPECGHNARCIYTAEAALPFMFPER